MPGKAAFPILGIHYSKYLIFPAIQFNKSIRIFPHQILDTFYNLAALFLQKTPLIIIHSIPGIIICRPKHPSYELY